MEKIFWQTDRRGMIYNSFGHMGGIAALLCCTQEGSPPISFTALCWKDSAHALHVVGRQHPCDASPLDCAGHPALINGSAVDDQVSVLEAHLVSVCCLIVVHGSVAAL